MQAEAWWFLSNWEITGLFCAKKCTNYAKAFCEFMVIDN